MNTGVRYCADAREGGLQLGRLVLDVCVGREREGEGTDVTRHFIGDEVCHDPESVEDLEGERVERRGDSVRHECHRVVSVLDSRSDAISRRQTR